MGIYGCNYQNVDNGCTYCENDNCLLVKHLSDRDITAHIELSDEKVDYPAILVLADTYYNDEKVTLASIKEAKRNTKYGYG